MDDCLIEVVLPTDQACCLPEGSRAVMLPGECTLLGGAPGGAGTSRTPNPCNATATRTRTWGRVKIRYR